MADFDTVWGNRCGTPYLCRMFAEKKGKDPEEVNGVQVFEAVNKQDPDAVECLQKFTKEIAVQLFNLQTVLDPERFAIGGGIHVISDTSSVKYKKISPRERVSFASRLSSDSIIYRVKTTAVCAVIAS